MATQRQRDGEAIAEATQIAQSVDATPEARSVGIIIGARAYRRGVNSGVGRSDNMVKSLEAEVGELRARLAEAEARAKFTPAECSYARTLNSYGMKPGEIGKVLGVSAADVRQAIRLAKDSSIRFASDRKLRA